MKQLKEYEMRLKEGENYEEKEQPISDKAQENVK